MNDKNTKSLFKRFKFLNKKNLQSIDCGDGWYKIVDNMCKELKAAGPPIDFCITYIGEKYGELEAHSKNGVMKTRVIIDQFNTQSIDICDECGNNKDLEMCDKCKTPEIIIPEEIKQEETEPCNSDCDEKT